MGLNHNKPLLKHAFQKSMIQRNFIESLPVILLLLCLIALPMSLLRIFNTGFLWLYAIHISLSVMVLIMFFFRKRLNEKALTLYSSSFFFALSIAGFLQHGLISAGFYFAMTTILIISVTRGMRAGLITAIIYGFIIGVIAFLWIKGFLSFPGSVEAYVSLPTAWVALSTAFLITTAIVFISISEYIKGLSNLVDTINDQKKQIEHLANHDYLTGLPTLRLATDRLDIAIGNSKRSGKKIAVLFLDLDNFKTINDTYGHDAGDEVLKKTAQRIKAAIRDHDTGCRIGGDEFFVILNNIDSSDAAKKICQRIIESIDQKVIYDKKQLSISVSIGGALYPDNADDAKSLRKKADDCLYEVKKSGKNSYKFV